MRLVLLCGLIAVHFLCANSLLAETNAPSAKPWVSRQTTFNIPFTVDLSNGTPREVQLFVSQDAGKTWHFYGRQVPTAKSFPFRAARDGDFWFVSRTIAPQRAIPPVEQLRPELHVQVDTKQPQLEFTAIAGTAGEVTTGWKAKDATLDPASLKIEYKSISEASWTTVTIDRNKAWEQEGSLLGEMTWHPEGRATSLTVRAEIADEAGNKTVVSRAISVNRPANPIARPTTRVRSATTPISQQTQPADSAQPTVAADSPTNNEPTPGGTTWPANNQLRTAPSAAEHSTQTAEQSNVDSASQARTPNETAGTATTANATPGYAKPSTAFKPNSSQTTHPVGLRTSLPAGEQARMTNSLHFQLDYELDSVGPEGVDEIQLWGTTNYGQSWVRWSLDEDLESPIDVQVKQEGIYGFRVVIVGRNGLATPAPHTGDLADIWVGVDTTRPTARITSAIYGDGVHAGELDIRWKVIDESIGDRAVTLLFSENPTGPWTTIAAGLPNSEQYYWSVDPNTPREIYLRLEVRDEAGNTTDHQLVEPISTTGLVPKAFIRSVRPVTDQPREAFLRNHFYQPR